MEKEIEKAIRETLVIGNPQSINIAVKKILRLFSVVGRSEQLQPDEEANRCKRCNCYGCVCDVIDGI
jgi:hypothetical protein